MKRYFLIVSLILIQSALVLAQTVTLKGQADKSYANNILRAYVYSDFISGRQEEIGEANVDEKGNFAMSFKAPATRFTMLRIDNAQATLYCEPGHTYNIDILPKDAGALETVGTFVPVDLTIYNVDSLELNYLIFRYTQLYDGFLAKKIGWNMKDQYELNQKIDTFCVRVKRKFSFSKNEYFQSHIDYTCAQLRSTFKKPELLYETYLKGRPVLFDHQEYMNFMNSFLTSVLGGASQSAEFKKQVNDVESLPGVTKYIRTLKYMENDLISELAIAKVLSMGFDDNSLKKDHLYGLLKAASTGFRNEQSKTIAVNLGYKFGRFLKGEPAPSFELTDRNGKTIKLEDLKGKYVYLAFYRSDCKVCEEELRLIPDYKKKYGKKFEFVYVSIDRDPAANKKFLEDYPKADWVFLQGSPYSKMAEDYEVVAIPLYYLITPQGTFMQAPALAPGIDLEKILSDITKKK
jgi:cytochrome oxidase Cu insertion factor (SCO1/SenC/PrrC family)